MIKMKTKKTTYEFSLDMKDILKITVKANSATEAKKLAFKIFKTRIKQKHLTMTYYDKYRTWSDLE